MAGCKHDERFHQAFNTLRLMMARRQQPGTPSISRLMITFHLFRRSTWHLVSLIDLEVQLKLSAHRMGSRAQSSSHVVTLHLAS